MAIVSELVTKFSFVGSLKPQQSFNKGLATSIKGLSALAVGIKASSALLGAWARNLYAPVDAMNDLHVRTNSSIESLQELGYAASQNGSSIDALGQSLTVLGRRAGRYAQFGGGAAKNAIEKIGLQVKDSAGNVRDSVDLFIDIAEKMRGLSEGEKLAVMQDFGISANMLQTLSLTREEIQALRNEARDLGVFTQEDADQVGAYGTATTKLRYAITSLQTTVAIGLAPVMTELAESFVDLIKSNKEWITEVLQKLGTFIINVSKAINRLMPVLLGLAGAFAVLKIATLGFGGALALVFSPVTLITAAIIGILAVVDDLIVAFRGGNSVIAKFFDEFLGVDIKPILDGMVSYAKKQFENLGQIIGGAIDFVMGLLRGIGALLKGDLSGAFGYFNEAAEGAFNAVSGVLNSLWDLIKLVFEDILDFDLTGLIDTFKNAANAIGAYFVDLGRRIKQTLIDIMPNWLKESLSFLGLNFDEAPEITQPSGNWEVTADEVPQFIFKGSEEERREIFGDSNETINNQFNSTPNETINNMVGGATQTNYNNQDVTFNITGSNAEEIGDKVANKLPMIGASGSFLSRGGM